MQDRMRNKQKREKDRKTVLKQGAIRVKKSQCVKEMKEKEIHRRKGKAV